MKKTEAILGLISAVLVIAATVDAIAGWWHWTYFMLGVAIWVMAGLG